MTVIFSASVVWLAMLVVAVLGGGVRGKLLEPRLGPLRAGQLETGAVAVLFAVGIWLYVGWARLTTTQAVSVGVAWCVATVAFETVLGRVVLKRGWGDVLADYNVAAGRLWPVVLLVLLLGPYVAAQWRHN